jgi:predicted  nucleic acid-binding Zn-ribbon protein
MSDTLQALQDTFEQLSDQIDLLSAACLTQAQRDSLKARYEEAQRNFFAARNKTFEENDAEVAHLTIELHDANKRIAHLVEEMGNISKVIDAVSEAVDIGTSIASKLIPA